MFRYMRYPGFKTKAVTFSYDDGMPSDRRLIQILDSHGMKGTFNLNSTTKYGNLPPTEVKTLFADSPHEVALHGKDHLSLVECSSIEGITDVLENRRLLEALLDKMVRGMAYANGSYNDEVVAYLKTLGVCYARTVEPTHAFNLPHDWLRLKPTCHHNDPELFRCVEQFLQRNPLQYYNRNPLLFYLWGHSYEFDRDNNWGLLEKFCAAVENRSEIWYATNMEIYEYTQAYRSLVVSADGSFIQNPTRLEVWFETGNKNYCLAPGETVHFKPEDKE